MVDTATHPDTAVSRCPKAGYMPTQLFRPHFGGRTWRCLLYSSGTGSKIQRRRAGEHVSQTYVPERLGRWCPGRFLPLSRYAILAPETIPGVSESQVALRRSLLKKPERPSASCAFSTAAHQTAFISVASTNRFSGSGLNDRLSHSPIASGTVDRS